MQELAFIGLHGSIPVLVGFSARYAVMLEGVVQLFHRGDLDVRCR